MKRPIALLMLTNVLGGVGVASGIAVGSLLVQQVAGTAWSGFGQALSVLGAAIAAVPLAQLAARRGRRAALANGYRIAAVGALAVILGAALQSAVALFVALLLFGAAQATNLQTRYAGAEYAVGPRKATLMSMVFWATTIGSATGPNLANAGNALGLQLGLPELSGPYLFGFVAFVLASAVAMMLPPPPEPAPAVPVDGKDAKETTGDGQPKQTTSRVEPARTVSAPQALKWALVHPTARYAVLLTALAHAVMVGVMSMTPVALAGNNHGLQVVGLVISLHILGMYALSPVFGMLADRIGAIRVSGIGIAVLLAAVASGAIAAGGALPLMTLSLVLLGLGWSAAIISASALLAGVDSGDVRVPLQGASDALMNYFGAGAAMLGGPIIAVVGFAGLNVAAALLLVPAAWAGIAAVRSRAEAR